MESKQINVLALAYLGDAVYEIYVRKYLLSLHIQKVDTLQKMAIEYVSARSQAYYLKQLLESSFLLDEEKTIVYRARNHKGSRHPRNTDLMTYKYSTGLEALIGYLYLEENVERIDEIMKKIVGE